jgi:hypothetical protein
MLEQHVLCGIHGAGLPAIACQHLRSAGSVPSVYLGWVQAAFDQAVREPGDLMAWCAECHRVYESAGGWNEDSEVAAGFRVICEACFWALAEAQRRVASA